jgi:hypothetical protein
MIPNSSLLPGSPLSSTVTLNEHAGESPLQVPEKRTVCGDPSAFVAITSMLVT